MNFKDGFIFIYVLFIISINQTKKQLL